MNVSEQVSHAIVDALKDTPDPSGNETLSSAFVACVTSAAIIAFTRTGIAPVDGAIARAATAATLAIRDVCISLTEEQAAKN